MSFRNSTTAYIRVKKKRILFVAPYPPPFSGPETSAKMFMASDITKRHEVSLFNTNFRKSNADKGKVNLNIVIIYFRFIFGLIFRIIKYRPHIIYYYVTATKIGWLYKDIWCIFISKLFFRKIIIHMRAGHFKNNFKSMPGCTQRLISFACSLVDLALAQSPTLKSQFEGLVIPGKIDFVYNMIDVQKYSPLEPVKKELSILFIGHLSKAKGYTDLLRAMPLVVHQNPDIQFLFAGTKLKEERNSITNYITGEILEWEDPQEVYDAYIRNKCDINYKYLGVLNERDKIKQIRSSTVFVLPSYSEGFSMAVLEAMSIGIPIVTCPVGALADIIHHNENGLLVNPGDYRALARAIISVLNDNILCREISLKCRKDVIEKFSIDVVAKRYIELFRKV